MKNRIFLLMIAALLIFCITACGAKTGPVSTADTQASDAKTEEKDTADAGTGDEAEETTTKPRVTRTQSTPSSDVDEGFIINHFEEDREIVRARIIVESFFRGFGVYIDGQPCGHIANKETVSYSVPFGTHTVHMTAGMSRKCVDMTVTLTPQAPIGYLKAHIKPGFISNTVVIESALPQDMPV